KVTTDESDTASLDAVRVSLTRIDEDRASLPSLRGTSRALGAITPNVCYRCHKEMYQLQEVAGPHQIGGPNGFNCTTCHDPHGKLLEESRKDLCLKCHTGTMNAAWHSSIHDHAGVMCTDCHNPHPESAPQQFVNISHTNIRRPQRLAMSVDDPNVCYRCHADIYAMNAMPSHHPIKEGKMVCGDCHNGHGAAEGNLKEATVNDVCYRCHADKQGPFVYEHPPVTENCSICHNPHGTVANNLLHQPTTFLCLRCHTGHRVGPGFGPHNALDDTGTTPSMQQAFYSDCSTCHAQIHGSDQPSPHNSHAFVR
ncbi:MAG: cytochrome c3 family protein, partial [Planctomycetaceae bacterium]|nr:cytochrome c3 family protein [Planctomycetaceae bacterium]